MQWVLANASDNPVAEKKTICIDLTSPTGSDTSEALPPSPNPYAMLENLVIGNGDVEEVNLLIQNYREQLTDKVLAEVVFTASVYRRSKHIVNLLMTWRANPNAAYAGLCHASFAENEDAGRAEFAGDVQKMQDVATKTGVTPSTALDWFVNEHLNGKLDEEMVVPTTRAVIDYLLNKEDNVFDAEMMLDGAWDTISPKAAPCPNTRTGDVLYVVEKVHGGLNFVF